MISIITDSASEFLKDYQDNYNVKVLPMPINFEEKSYLTGVDISNIEFYEKLQKAHKLPTTSMVNSFTFKTAFEEEIKKGNDVVAIVISSNLSVTYEQAVIASKEVNEQKIFVVDSKSCSLGQTCLVLEAVKLRNENKTAEEIFNTLNELKTKIKVLAMVDTLKYLKAGGRLSSTQAAIGTVLHVKPLVAVEDGKVVSKSKALGKLNGFKKIIENINSADIDKTKSFVLAHSCDDKIKTELETLINKETNVTITNIVNIGATIGVHSGPGTIGVAYFIK